MVVAGILGATLLERNLVICIKTPGVSVFFDPLFPVIEIDPKEIIRGLQDAIVTKIYVNLTRQHHSFIVVKNRR